MDYNPLSNFKIGGTQIPVSYFNIKNHNEMSKWIQHTIPQMIYSEEFLEILTDIEMSNLIRLRLEREKAKRKCQEKVLECEALHHRSVKTERALEDSKEKIEDIGIANCVDVVRDEDIVHKVL
jgi:hypothetical protein